MADNDKQTQDSINVQNLGDSCSLLHNLRQRWELASVLNFFNVFEPLIGKELNVSAEELEDALINPNYLLSKLHITLLKGIPPVNKNLSKSDALLTMSKFDAWVTILCKKFAEWWEWVAEGEVPLCAGKGEEISRYKELDPITRLLMLKALCEIRAEQDDLAAYINDALKNGAHLSQFRKDKIGQDKNGTSYWYDGNSITGHRLYREVNLASKQKYRGKNCVDMHVMKSEWETLATNLEEFREVSGMFSSCQVGVEAVVHETIETEVIPVLEKMQKAKERKLKRQQREETWSLAYEAGVTRSCRTRRTVKYTFDEYDRTIDEAIELTRNRKGREVKKTDPKHQKHGKRGGDTPDGDSPSDVHSNEEPPASTSEGKENGQLVNENSDNKENDRVSEDSNFDEENDHHGEGGENDEEDDQRGESSDNDEQNDLQSEEMSDKNVDSLKNTNVSEKSDDEIVNDSESSDFELENDKPDDYNLVNFLTQGKKKTSRPNHLKARSPEAKNRYRQRPVRNTSFVVSDSEEEIGS